MNNKQDNMVNCSQFEELLTDYLDKTLDAPVNKAMASHALSCPLCHSLLNDVKESLHVCREISAPAMPMSRLEARILSMTTPEASMACDDFEDHLTDYLDGFLPAAAFHRWERHAALCGTCEDMPGMVVRSIAACYTYKTEELAIPEGLHERILQMTIGTVQAADVKASLTARIGEWVRGLSFPVAVPQLAPVAMMLMFALMIFSQTVSADGSLSGVYQKSFELAEQTYQQGADAFSGKAPAGESEIKEPVTGTTFVSGDNK